MKVGRVVNTGLSLEVGEGQQLGNCRLIFTVVRRHGLRLSLSMGLNVTIGALGWYDFGGSVASIVASAVAVRQKLRNILEEARQIREISRPY